MSTVKAYFPLLRTDFRESSEGKVNLNASMLLRRKKSQGLPVQLVKVCGSQTEICPRAQPAVVKEQKSRNNSWVMLRSVGLGHLIHLQSSKPHLPPLFQVRQPQFTPPTHGSGPENSVLEHVDESSSHYQALNRKNEAYTKHKGLILFLKIIYTHAIQHSK